MQRPYLKDRLIEEHPEGFVVIVPVGSEPPVPLVCPICDHVLYGRDDELSHAEFSCCDRCARLWAHPRRSDWKNGWRPTSEQVLTAEEQRTPMVLVLDVD